MVVTREVCDEEAAGSNLPERPPDVTLAFGQVAVYGHGIYEQLSVRSVRMGRKEEEAFTSR